MRCLITTPSLPYTPLLSCYPPWQLHDIPRFQELVELVSALPGTLLCLSSSLNDGGDAQFKARELPTNHPIMHFNAAAYFAVGRDHIQKHSRGTLCSSASPSSLSHTHTIMECREHE
jgi:hypothetical protein